MLLRDLIDGQLLGQMLEERYVSAQKHPTEPLEILNYTQRTQFDRAWNPVTRQCRGLIYNFETGEVVARPWPKFFNFGEAAATGDPLDGEIDYDAPVVVTDKWDGSLGILYWTWEGPAVATRGSFTSEQALWATEWFRAHWDTNFFSDPTRTFLFEIVADWNRIVVKYDWEGLVLLGIRETESGRDLDLPDDPWLLQAWPPRNDPGEHLRSTEDGLEDVPSVSSGGTPQGSGAPPREAKCDNEALARREPGSRERAPSGGEAKDSGRTERGERGAAVRGLREDVPEGLHGLRPRQGEEALQRGSSEDAPTTSRGDREVRTGLRELSSDQDTFRVVERFEYRTLAEALEAEPRPNAEGLVVHFLDTNERVKLKQEDYIVLHRILTGTNARNVWEVAAVRACADYIAEPKHWGTYLGMDPARAAECLVLGDDWLEAVPDEFHEWVCETTRLASATAADAYAGALDYAEQVSEIAERAARYSAVRQHPMVTEIMRVASAEGFEKTQRARNELWLRCWREACPEPTAPFARSEAVA